MDLFLEDGRPRSREFAEMARRVAVVRWFAGPPHQESRPAARRVAQAVYEHAQSLPLDPPPAGVRILSPDEGRAAIRDGHLDPGRTAWEQRLRSRCEEVRARLLESRRAEGHPLMTISGEAVLLRPALLPVPAERMTRELAGPMGSLLPAATVERLIDRLLWEVGALLAWELAGDLLGPNPFLPLLVIYEEGLYPLDLSGEVATLWAPV